MKLRCSQHELQEMAGSLQKVTESFQRVSEMVDTSVPPVKYPRTPGYRPLAQDNPFNAWAWRCDIQGAATGKLTGKTIAIKDSTAVAGVPMRNGSKILDGYIPEFDATVVSRILDEGGHITGKTTVEDLCLSASSFTSSDGPVRNPHDETCISGGSSTGSAALVCAGLVDMATGGDQGGSIRIPASCTGIVGLKPTWGLVPYTGAASGEPTVDHLGPMAKTVADCALLLEVMAGYDEGRDPRQYPPIFVPEYSKLIEQDVRGKTIGLLTEGFEKCTEEVVKKVVRDAAETLTQAGCIVKETSVPMHKDGGVIYQASSAFSSMKCMHEYNGTGIFMKGFYPTSMQEAMHRGQATHPHDLPPVFKCNAMANRYISQVYGNRFHSKAQNMVNVLSDQYDEALKMADVLILPTIPRTVSKIPSAEVSFSELFRICFHNCSNTCPFNLTGHPAISINAGFSPPDPVSGKSTLPIGMMIVGKKFDEVTVLQVARAFEKLRGNL